MGPCSITGVAALDLRGFGSGKQGGRRECGGERGKERSEEMQEGHLGRKAGRRDCPGSIIIL